VPQYPGRVETFTLCRDMNQRLIWP